MRPWILGLLLAVLLVDVAPWHPGEASVVNPGSGPQGRSVAAAPGWVDAAGGIRRLGVRADGRLDSMSVAEGQKVADGQELLRLDDRALKLQQELSALDVQRAQEHLAALEARRVRAKAALDRLAPLVRAGAETSDELLQARSDLAALESEVQQARGAASAARIQIRIVEGQLDALLLRAPGAGRVLRVLAHPGDSVQAGAPLIWFAAEGAQRVHAELDERLLGTIRVGMHAEVTSEYADVPVHPAIVEQIAPVIGPAQGKLQFHEGPTDDRVVDVLLRLEGEGEPFLFGQHVLVRFVES